MDWKSRVSRGSSSAGRSEGSVTIQGEKRAGKLLPSLGRSGGDPGAGGDGGGGGEGGGGGGGEGEKKEKEGEKKEEEYEDKRKQVRTYYIAIEY